MDYMQELASHPDMPQALNALRLRWQELFAPSPAPAAGAGDGLTVLKERWKRLFGGGPRPIPESAKQFEELKSCWDATRQLVEEDLADAHQNAAGVQPLIEEHPNVWIAQVVHEFYRLPKLAADAWLELKYCDQFPNQLANHVRAHAGRGWFIAQEAHDQAQRSAEKISPAKTPPPGTPAIDPELRRQEITHASKRMRLVHKAPHFIQDLIDRKTSPDKWFGRTRPPGGETAEQLAYRLIANPKEVSDLACTFKVPVPFSMVLQSELEQIRATREWVRDTPDGERTTSMPREPPKGGEPAKEGASFRQALREDLLGLAFSGGGIRSATFNLGVLQSLAKIGLLKHCDYLSTVSGGGYIGGWFTAWMHRQSGTRKRSDAINDMQRRLSPLRNANPVADAVRPIRYLREYSNYLTPRTGFLSADTWTMIGIFTRNALLNQVILVSLFAGLLLMPRVIVKIAGAGAATPGTDWPLIVIGVLLAVATLILIMNLRRLDPLSSEDREDKAAAVARAVEGEVPKYARPLVIQLGVVMPWLLAMSLLILRLPDILTVLPAGRVTAAVASLGWPLLLSTIVAVSASFYVALILGFGKAARCWKGDPGGLIRSFGSAILVGGLAAGAVSLALIQLFEIAGLDRGIARPWHAAVLGGPAAMLVISILIIVVLGMLGEKFPDEHREWWSRFRTFIHMYTVGCLAWFAFALYVPWAWHGLQDYSQVSQWSGWTALLAWLGSTFAGVRAGGSAEEKNGDAPPTGITTVLIRGISFVAPYVFIVGLIVAISLVLDVVVRHDNPMGNLSGSLAYWTYVTQWNDAGLWMLGLTFGCFVVGLMFSYRVDINAFSMHHFYKNRLVRCYLGASHDDRKADWFTGFDPDDDLRLADLDHRLNCKDDKDVTRKYPGPYPILNCALNLVGGKDLAWQERKAESFVFTPKYCGFDLDRAVLNKSTIGYAEAYVPTRAFYRDGEGPLLGMAMAISGAAANPNMGQATSPASAFLLTVFNARLGWWVGNPRNQKSASQPGPPFGLAYTARELTGSTDDEKEYVNVSDGGHFENLGVYELIRRGCRYIIACDAGQDGEFTFQDLGNLVRRCRTDFGVEIDISLDRIRNRDANMWSQVHCVVGTIHYLNIPRRDWRGQLLNEDDLPLRRGDRPAHEMGYLIYLKPSITGDEPHDVLEYGLRVPEFPHESTADQWFGEGQFEAYRRLGMHIGECAFSRFLNDDRKPIHDIGWLFERLHKFWHPPTTAIAQHSTEHTRVYSTIMERVRTIPHLAFLDHTLFDGLPSTTLASIGGAPLSPQDERSEFYVINSMIQLMEDVYADLHLEDNFDHPHVEGWMAVFRRWAIQEAFQRTWAISRCTYAERFRRFYDDRLVKRRIGRRPLTFESNFIAAHRGRIAAGKVGNMMSDFRAAIAAKAEVIELDVRKLKGDTLVVFHDDALGGTQLSTVDYTAFLALPGGSDIPTLSDCLNELRGKVQLDIELKDKGSVPKVLEEIRKAAWNTDDFVITSFLPEVPSQVRELREDVQAGLLLEEPDLAAKARRLLRSPDVDFIAPEYGPWLTPELLEECAACGMPVVPWTVNTEDAIANLFKHPAVAGVITDEVALALSARQSVR